MSTDVKFANYIDVRFPDCCIQCGHERPNDTYVVRADKADFTLGTLLMPWLWYSLSSSVGRKRIAAPACTLCKAQMLASRRKRGLVTFSLAVAAAVPTFWLVKQYNLPKIVAVLIPGAAMLIPWFWWEVNHPLPIEVSEADKLITYQFRDAAYAAKFAAMNRGRL